MPHNITLITTIVAALSFGLIFGLLAVRLKLPALVGYLTTGVIIGPSTPGFVADAALTTQLSELGVMLLMFGVGLHFSLRDLLKVRRIALPGAILQIIITTGMGMALAQLWGWSLTAGLLFGLSLSVASTVVMICMLSERGVLESVNGRIAMGWLVVEDLIMVIVLVLLPPLANIYSGNQNIETSVLWETLALTVAQLAAFFVFMLVVGRQFFPWFLWRVARTGSRELFTLSIVTVGIGVAYGSSHFFGVSFALGAFFAGMVLRKSALIHRAAEQSLPLRDAFSVLFFISVGMLFQPNVLIDNPIHILATVAVIILGKSLVAFLLVLALRSPLSTALTVSASLAQIGEFSFILAALGLSLELLSAEVHSIILASALISIALNPFLFRMLKPLQKWLQVHFKLARKLEQITNPLTELSPSAKQEKRPGQVVIIGYGKVGKKVAECLIDRGIHFVVVEQNRKLVEHLRKQGVATVHGNAADPSALVQAHVAQASMLVIATSLTYHTRSIVKNAKAINPSITSLIRTNGEDDAQLLEEENIGKVFLGEHELATAMARHTFEILEKEKR